MGILTAALLCLSRHEQSTQTLAGLPMSDPAGNPGGLASEVHSYERADEKGVFDNDAAALHAAWTSKIKQLRTMIDAEDALYATAADVPVNITDADAQTAAIM